MVWRAAALLLIITFQAFKSMRQRANMSPVSSSVPVGSVRQDDILTRDLQPRAPRGLFTTSVNKDACTRTAVCTCTLRAHLNGLGSLPMFSSRSHYLAINGANGTKTRGGEVNGI